MPTLLGVYVTIFLLNLPSHPRCLGRLEELQARLDAEDSVSYKKRWRSFSTGLVRDLSGYISLCTMELLASLATLGISHRTQDDVVAPTAVITACLSATTIFHACCMKWHLVGLERDPTAFQHWRDAPTRRASMLLAAPLAWMLWSIFSMSIMFAVALQRLPLPICLEPVSSPSRVFLQCRHQDPTQEFILLTPASSIVGAVLLMVGVIHLAFHMYYFTMLVVPHIPLMVLIWTYSLSIRLLLALGIIDAEMYSTLSSDFLDRW